MKSRLNRADWINHGLKELRDSGYKALNAQSLSKKLNVSRGSFYWHFKDIKEFKTEVIGAWRKHATENIIDAVNRAATPRLRFESLIMETLRSPKIELSIRAWATASQTVANAVKEIDAQRYAFVENMLREIGVKEEDIKYRSLLMYWAAIGRTVVAPGNLQEVTDREATKLAELMSS